MEEQVYRHQSQNNYDHESFGTVHRVLAYTAELVAAIVDEDSPRVLVCNSQSPAPATRQENKNNQPLCYSISRRKNQHSGRQVEGNSRGHGELVLG